MIAESAINRESRDRKLQSNGVSSPRGAPEQNEILTLAVTANAFSHELSANFKFTHSLKSGVGDDGWKVVLPLLSGVERHRCAKSVVKFRLHVGEASKRDSPETQVVIGPVIQTSLSAVFMTSSKDSAAFLIRPEAYRASQRRCRIGMSRLLNFHPDICQRWQTVGTLV